MALIAPQYYISTIISDLEHLHILGLDNLYNIVSGGTYELRVDLEDFEDNAAFAKYMTFFIDPEPSNYTLTIGGYDASSTAGDGLTKM